jgi:hypothetical protein
MTDLNYFAGVRNGVAQRKKKVRFRPAAHSSIRLGFFLGAAA